MTIDSNQQIACETCGNTYPKGTLYCAGCGKILTADERIQEYIETHPDGPDQQEFVEHKTEDEWIDESGIRRNIDENDLSADDIRIRDTNSMISKGPVYSPSGLSTNRSKSISSVQDMLEQNYPWLKNDEDGIGKNEMVPDSGSPTFTKTEVPITLPHFKLAIRDDSGAYIDSSIVSNVIYNPSGYLELMMPEDTLMTVSIQDEFRTKGISPENYMLESSTIGHGGPLEVTLKGISPLVNECKQCGTQLYQFDTVCGTCDTAVYKFNSGEGITGSTSGAVGIIQDSNLPYTVGSDEMRAVIISSYGNVSFMPVRVSVNEKIEKHLLERHSGESTYVKDQTTFNIELSVLIKDIDPTILAGIRISPFDLILHTGEGRETVYENVVIDSTSIDNVMSDNSTILFNLISLTERHRSTSPDGPSVMGDVSRIDATPQDMEWSGMSHDDKEFEKLADAFGDYPVYISDTWTPKRKSFEKLRSAGMLNKTWQDLDTRVTIKDKLNMAAVSIIGAFTLLWSMI